MQTQALGGGILFAVAAVLWALYFLPTWAKRRQFRVAEHNALRIQRTLRMLAETTEVPNEVRVEASAKEALAQERLLASTERIAVAQQRARLAEAKLAERKAALEAREAKRQAALMRRELIKRSRIVRVIRVALAVLAALALIGMATGVVLGVIGFGWAVVSASAGTLLIAALTLMAIAPTPQHVLEQRTAVRSTEAPARAVPIQDSVRVEEAPVRSVRQARRERATRVPVARQTEQLEPASAQDVLAAKALLERARVIAEAQQREAAHSPARAVSSRESREQPVAQRAPQRPGEPQPSQQSRLHTMGVLDDLEAELPNLDEALQRRRAAS